METGAERVAIRCGYLAGKNLAKTMRVWPKFEQDRPQIVQMFSADKASQNSVVKV